MGIEKRPYGNTSLSETIGRGEAFLRKGQAEDGHWTDFMSPQAGESTQWVTGYVGGTLGLTEPNRPFLGKARKWLMDTELKGGGWGYKTDFLPDADSTANALYFLSRNSSSDKTLLHRLGDFLLSFREEETGGFTTYRPLPFPLGMQYMSASSIWCKPEISVSAMTGLAFFSVDPVRYENTLTAVSNFLLESKEKEGFWESCWWDNRIYGTWISCEFFNRLGDAGNVEKSISWLCSQMTREGAWGDCYGGSADPFNTALALSLLCLSLKLSTHSTIIENGIKWLINAQNEDGSWAGSARVREPEPWNHRPWEPEIRHSTVIVHDINRFFTTATVLRALSSIIPKGRI